MSKLSDQWQTPQDLFDVLDKGGGYMGIHFDGYHFDIDLCATEDNSKCNLYLNDFLANRQYQLLYQIDGDPDLHDSKDEWLQICNTAFMNPPYSNPKPFIEKAWKDSKHCKIVCLVKVDPSTKWWSTFWDYSGVLIDYNTNEKLRVSEPGPKPGCQVIFFPKRIKFDPPQQLIDSGEVYKFKNKWAKECLEHEVFEKDKYKKYIVDSLIICPGCKGKGYKELTGLTFPSCLVVMDRRGL